MRPRAGHALPALGLALGVTVALLAYPAWYGLAGPQAVTGVLFAIAPIAGRPALGVCWCRAPTAPPPTSYIRFGGYLGPHRASARLPRLGRGLWPPSASVVVAAAARSPGCCCSWRPLTFWLALGAYLISAPGWLGHPWLPWRDLAKLPVLKEILPDQFAPFLTLFLAFLLAVGLDALHVACTGGLVVAGGAPPL